MKYFLIIDGVHPWRHKHHILHAGRYKVPEDVPESIAQKAKKDGAAVIEYPGAKMKTKAPEDKKRPAAAENKSHPT